MNLTTTESLTGSGYSYLVYRSHGVTFVVGYSRMVHHPSAVVSVAKGFFLTLAIPVSRTYGADRGQYSRLRGAYRGVENLPRSTPSTQSPRGHISNLLCFPSLDDNTVIYTHSLSTVGVHASKRRSHFVPLSHSAEVAREANHTSDPVGAIQFSIQTHPT